MQVETHWLKSRGLTGPPAGLSIPVASGCYWTPQASLLTVNDEPKWSFTRSGDYVFVPVKAYRVERAYAAVWGLGIQLGVLACESFRKAAGGHEPTGLVLVIGDEIADLGTTENAFRCYAGVAVRTADR